MNKIFLFEKHVKESEDYNKLSKSVSYETLVGGTTTAGTVYEQTQCLSKCSADAPLDAVGTLTSQLCCSAKVVEKSLQTLPVFRLVKILSLVIVLSVLILSESRAECNKTNNNGEIINEKGNYCGTCGTNCNWVIEEGTLKITGSGAMTNYSDTKDGSYFNTTPWKDYGNLFTSVDIQGISSIGYAAFAFLGNITDVTIGDSVKNIGAWAFRDDNLSSLVISDSVSNIGTFAFDLNNLSAITIPDSATDIGEYAFASNPITSITIPDTVDSIAFCALGINLDRLNNLEIICKGNRESCANLSNLLKNYCYRHVSGKCEDSIDLSGKVSLATETQCTGNYYWSGSSCNNKKNGIKCAENWKQIETWCNRIRYTPAEAAEVLKDTDNEIIMTFKVNR